MIFISQAQLVTGPFECGKDGIEFCNKFLQSGGISCERSTPVKCFNKDQNNENSGHYCAQMAKDNCNLFISKYGFLCNATNCIMSLYTG